MFYYILSILLLLCAALALEAPQSSWLAKFRNDTLSLQMGKNATMELSLSNIDVAQRQQSFHLLSKHMHLAQVIGNGVIPVKDVDPTTRTWHGNITIYGNFLGSTNISVHLYDANANTSTVSPNQLAVSILRPSRIIDHVFVGSVILLMSLLYINFGAALDVSVLRSLLVRPIGPIIGLLTQFIAMPLLSYGLAMALFPDSPELQLGLFFTGVSPSGGASNTWTVVLGGNINLSVLMTTLGNLIAFATMPLWIFTLGKLIFERGNMSVPYGKIATFAISLIVPLAIGLAIQKWAPRLARILVRLLKPISSCLILFIVIFAMVTNWYIFELFSWQIVVAGLALPWLGYILAWLLAKFSRQNSADAMTIAIETGIQNTGISIFMLTLGLPQPQADLTTVVPVAVAIMTPFPLLALWLYKRFVCPKNGERLTSEAQNADEEHMYK